MKLITAIIRAYQTDQVREELIEAGITRVTVSRVSGHGAQVREEIYRGQKVVPDLFPKVRLEIAVNEDFVETTIEAIMKGVKGDPNKEGEVGDGKIFITNLEECIRIRTNERGGTAI